MADTIHLTPDTASSPGFPSESAKLSPSEQARIRRERRAAKVRDGPSRLNRITSTQGSTFIRDKPPVSPSPPARVVDTEAHDDPPEVDISRHFYEPARNRAEVPEDLGMGGMGGQDDLMTMMMGIGNRNGNGSEGIPGAADDPMLAFLKQMQGAGMPGMPPGMSMPPGMGMPGQAPEGMVTYDPMNKLWKLLHFVCSMALSLWVIFSLPGNYNGSEVYRLESTESYAPQLFYGFATMELLLQSARYVIEAGKPPQNSWLTTIAGFIPPPFSTALTTLARYQKFWGTAVADAGVVIFCLGIAGYVRQ